MKEACIYIIIYLLGVIMGGFGIFTMMMLIQDKQAEKKFINKASCSYADEYYCLDNIECCKKPQYCE